MDIKLQMAGLKTFQLMEKLEVPMLHLCPLFFVVPDFWVLDFTGVDHLVFTSVAAKKHKRLFNPD